ncbi:MAG TPA: hypothetical protein VGZ02_13080 [Candidatus Baltobacteraceae bacterium]|jgi:hypothetical protein|nr:hypothetical protein [Candidatus Baltobacteraceae bacterium]
MKISLTGPFIISSSRDKDRLGSRLFGLSFAIINAAARLLRTLPSLFARLALGTLRRTIMHEPIRHIMFSVAALAALAAVVAAQLLK